MANPLSGYTTAPGQLRQFRAEVTDEVMANEIHRYRYTTSDRLHLPDGIPASTARQLHRLASQSDSSVAVLAYLLSRPAWVAWVIELGEATEIRLELCREASTRRTLLNTFAMARFTLRTPGGVWAGAEPNPYRREPIGGVQSVAPRTSALRSQAYVDLRMEHVAPLEPPDMLRVDLRSSTLQGVMDVNGGMPSAMQAQIHVNRFSVAGFDLPGRLGELLYNPHPNTGTWRLHAALALCGRQAMLGRFAHDLAELGNWPLYAIDAATFTDQRGIENVRIYLYGCAGPSYLPDGAEVLGHYLRDGTEPEHIADRTMTVRVPALAKAEPAAVAIQTPRFNSNLSRRLTLPTTPVEDDQNVAHLSNKEHQNSINLRLARRNRGAVEPGGPRKPD